MCFNCRVTEFSTCHIEPRGPSMVVQHLHSPVNVRVCRVARISPFGGR